MDSQEEIENTETVQYSKIEIPQCEVVIDEADNTFVDSSQLSVENMITYVVIPSDIDTDRIIINYCVSTSINSVKNYSEMLLSQLRLYL